MPSLCHPLRGTIKLAIFSIHYGGCSFGCLLSCSSNFTLSQSFSFRSIHPSPSLSSSIENTKCRLLGTTSLWSRQKYVLMFKHPPLRRLTVYTSSQYLARACGAQHSPIRRSYEPQDASRLGFLTWHHRSSLRFLFQVRSASHRDTSKRCIWNTTSTRI